MVYSLEASSSSFKINTILLLSVLCGVTWFAIDAFVLPPGFGGTDIYYFKDAGINFSEGLGFVSRFTFGNPTFEYQPYSQYPPIYPLLFGVFVKLFGTSALTNQIFNSLLSFFLGVTASLALKPVTFGWPPRFAPHILAAIFVVAVFAAFFFPEGDRPDGLGVCFGLLALIVLNQGATRKRELAAGAFCAVAWFTSPFAGIWASIAVMLVIFARQSQKGGPRQIALPLCFAAGGALAVMIILGAAIAALLPGWFPAFFGVLTGTTTHNETGGGYFLALLKGDIKTWASGFPLGFSGFYVGLAKLLAVGGSLAGALVWARFRFGSSWHGWLIAALLAASPLCLITSPYQVNYPPMTAALLLAAAASLTLGMPPVPRRHFAAATGVGFALLSLLSIPYKSREVILRAGTRPSLERAVDSINRDRTAIGSSGGFLAVSPTAYMVWRQAGIRPLIAIYSGFDKPENRKSLAYLALSYPGSHNPFEPQKPDWLSDEQYRLVSRPDLPQLAMVFGRVISTSSQTWESAIYVARREAN